MSLSENIFKESDPQKFWFRKSGWDLGLCTWTSSPRDSDAGGPLVFWETLITLKDRLLCGVPFEKWRLLWAFQEHMCLHGPSSCKGKQDCHPFFCSLRTRVASGAQWLHQRLQILLGWDSWTHGLGMWGGSHSSCWGRPMPENYLQLATWHGNTPLLGCLWFTSSRTRDWSTLGEKLQAAALWDSRAGEAGGHASRRNQARGENTGWWLRIGVGGWE